MDEKVQIESTNFQYLQKSWPHLYEHANFAEQNVYTDPHTSIVKLRCFAEELVGYLYRELNLPCERDNSFFDKLNSNVFIEIIDKTIAINHIHLSPLILYLIHVNIYYLSFKVANVKIASSIPTIQNLATILVS